MEKNNISCVISDVRISPMIAAGYNLGLPVLCVTNITFVSELLLRRRRDNYLLKKPVDYAIKTASIFADEIIIPDFPPPNNICHYTLSKNNSIKKKISFVGPLVNKKLY